MLPSLRNFGAPSIADLGELGASLRVLPSGSTTAISALAGLSSAWGYFGMQAHINQIWLRNDPPNAPMKKVIRQDVLLCDLRELQIRRLVMAHDHRAPESAQAAKRSLRPPSICIWF